MDLPHRPRLGCASLLVVALVMAFASPVDACDEMCGDLTACMQQGCVDGGGDDFEARCRGIGELACGVLDDIVDPTDCDATLANVSGVSPGFDDRCGFTGPRQSAAACDAPCQELWSCTQEDASWCPGFDSSDHDRFMDVCTALTPCDALHAIVDPDDCAATVHVMSIVHDKFADQCSGIGDVDVDPTHVGTADALAVERDVYVYGCGHCRMGRGPRGDDWPSVAFALVAATLALRRRHG